MKQNKIDRIMKYYNIFSYLYIRFINGEKHATLLSVYKYSIACAEKDKTGSSWWDVLDACCWMCSIVFGVILVGGIIYYITI